MWGSPQRFGTAMTIERMAVGTGGRKTETQVINWKRDSRRDGNLSLERGNFMASRFIKLVVPQFLKEDHLKNGGRVLHRFYRDVPDGYLRVMLGYEPAGENNRMIWHLSVSVSNSLDAMTDSTRAPTDEECQSAFELQEISRPWKEEGSTLVRHFWEE